MVNSLDIRFRVKELAKFFDGTALHRRRDLHQHGSERDYGDGDEHHGRDRFHLLQQLAGICTFHNSSALDLDEFQFPVLVNRE